VKLFTACLLTETNTFSPVPTGRGAFFTDQVFHRNNASLARTGTGFGPLALWRQKAEADRFAVVESICAYSEPSAAVVKTVYEELRDMILSDLRAALPVQGVLLFLHGAMVADGYDDCEGDVIARCREIVGPDVPIGVELDLHCHLTDSICDTADVLVIYKEYPHTDTLDRAVEVYDLTLRTIRREIKPVIALHDCRMLGMWRTPVEPARSFVARMAALEGRDGILSVSFGHGFPWADVPEVGAKMVVMADGDMAKAKALAATLADELWAMRDRAVTPHDTADAAIDFALAAPSGPVVLADVADNAGGGGPSDSTFLLRRLVERNVQGAAVGCIWDPIAVSFCFEAGVGAAFDLRIGGKCGPVSGAPIDLHVTVMALDETHTQTSLMGNRASYGRSAWVRAGGVDIILVAKRQQVFSPDAFTGLGCTLADKRIVVVKSMQHFYANFAPIAAAVRYVTTPGTVGADFANLPYKRVTRALWPAVADPFAAAGG
jgi:microcystin degradation protein MlrC